MMYKEEYISILILQAQANEITSMNNAAVAGTGKKSWVLEFLPCA